MLLFCIKTFAWQAQNALFQVVGRIPVFEHLDRQGFINSLLSGCKTSPLNVDRCNGFRRWKPLKRFRASARPDHTPLKQGVNESGINTLLRPQPFGSSQRCRYQLNITNIVRIYMDGEFLLPFSLLWWR